VGQLVPLHRGHRAPVTAVRNHCGSTADSEVLCVLSSSTPCCVCNECNMCVGKVHQRHIHTMCS
jgi:hypothetical protein